jgi:hypothetical protein
MRPQVTDTAVKDNGNDHKVCRDNDGNTTPISEMTITEIKIIMV